jgi:hypothetical protein
MRRSSGVARRRLRGTRSIAEAIRRERALLLAAVLFAAVFVARVLDPRPADAVLMLCVVPIATCAIARGPVAGVLAERRRTRSHWPNGSVKTRSSWS